jgi:hypothetical protein
MSVPQDKIYNVYWEGPFEWKQIDTAQRASISLPKRLKKGKKSAVIEEWNSETNGSLLVVSFVGQPPCTATFPKLTELQIKEKRHANSKSHRRDRRG